MAKRDTRTNRPDKIIRVEKEVLNSLADYYSIHGSWSKALRAYIQDNDRKPLWTLPSFLFNTKAQANGEALKRAVQSGDDPTARENPIKVRSLDE